MNGALTSTFWPLIWISHQLRRALAVFGHWWSGRAPRYQRELIDIDPITPVTVWLDQEINALIGQAGQGASGATQLPETGLKWLPNIAVRDTLRAARQLASPDQAVNRLGLQQLEQVIDVASKQRKELENQLGPDSNNVLRPGRPRHLIAYYGTVQGLLQIRKARALARLSPARPDESEKAFQAAQLEQPGMLYVAIEYARYLSSRGRFDDADRVLGGVRSGLTAAGRYELASARVQLTRDCIAAASAERRLRPLLARVIQDGVALESCWRELNLARGSDEARDLLGWRALAAMYQGEIHDELGELDLALTAYRDGLELYSLGSDVSKNYYVSSEMYMAEQIGNLYFRLGRLGQALSYYDRAVTRWRDGGQPADRTVDVKRIAGRSAIAAMMAYDGPLSELNVAELSAEGHGPLQTLTDLPNPLLALPGLTERLRLGLDARLRREPGARAVRDILYSLRTLMGNTPAAGGFLVQEEDAKAIPNWAVLVRLELDIGLLGLFQTPASVELVLLERAKQARLKVQEDWGIQLRGLQVADGPKGQRGYRILIRGRVAEQGVVPGGGALTALLQDVHWRATAGWPRPEGAVAPAAEIVFQALETCLDRNMPRLVCHNELWWLLGKYELVPATGAASAEAVSARSMVPLLYVLRRLLSQRVKPRDTFPAIFASVQKGLAAGRSLDDIAAAILGTPEAPALADLAWDGQRDGQRDDRPPPVPGAPSAEPAPEAGNGPPAPRLDRETARRGLGEHAKSKVRSSADAAARRREDFDYATELALDRYSANTITLRASAISYLWVQNWAANKQTDRLRAEVYAGTGIWLPPIAVQRGDELDAQTCQIGYNDWHASIAVPPAASGDALRLGISRSLDGRLAAFMGNRQLELLLHRLSTENQLLVSNLLERFPIPAILDEMRRLLDARRSVGNMLDLAENMLLNQYRPDPERWTLLCQAMPEFYAAV